MKKSYLLVMVILFNINIFGNYKIKNGKIYFNDSLVYIEDPYTYETINPDLNTFKIINNLYAKDKFTVYRGDSDIKFSDPKSFEPLELGFSKDKNNVYKYKNIVKDIDSNTFVIFFNQKNNFLYGYIFFRDKNGIYASSNVYDNLGTYCQLHKSNVDLKSFNILKDGYVEYNGKIYYGCNKIEEADKDTFTALELGFSKDKKNIYYYTNKLPKFDVDTFEIFQNQKDESYIFYLKDKNGIYALIEKNQIPFEYEVQKISTDIKNFEILNDKIARDKKYKYIFDDENKVLKRY